MVFSSSFRAFWNDTNKIDAAAVDAYNVQFLFGRGFVSEDGAYVYFDYAMDLDGGVTRDHIVSNLNNFLTNVSNFSGTVKP